MYKKIIKPCICVILAVLQVGCSSSYRLNLRTRPAGATVKIDGETWGTTPCDIDIPQDSLFINNEHIDITYQFPDGQTFTKNYDLRHYKPPNEFPAMVAAAFALPGALLVCLSVSDEDDPYISFDDEDDHRTNIQWKGAGIGLGLVGIGILAYYLLGGNERASDGYDIVESEQNLWLTNQ
jgi:hypothetical protein